MAQATQPRRTAEEDARLLGLTISDADEPAYPSGLNPDETARKLGLTVEPATRVPSGVERFLNTALERIGNVEVGFGKDLLKGAIGAGELVAPVLRQIPGVRGFVATPDELSLAKTYVHPEGTAEKIGAFAGEVAQFAVPASKVTKAAAGARVASQLLARGVTAQRARQVATAVEAAAQGVTGFGVAKTRGDEGATTVGALSAAGPLAGKAMEVAGPAIRAKAEKKLAQLLATGLAEKANKTLVGHAIKTGEDAVRPDVQKSVDIVNAAASELLDLPVAASWGKWQTMLASRTESAKKLLGTALKTPFGDVRVPTEPVVKALDDLIETGARHMAETAPKSGSSTLGMTQAVTFDQPLFKELVGLKEQVAQYGTGITVRNLVDLKRVWDHTVYTLATAGKVNADPTTLISSAMKEAAFTGANAIRRVLEESSPTVAKLDEVVSHAIRLENLVKQLYAAHPGMSENARRMFMGVGAAAGVAGAKGIGIAYPGSILGAGVGAAAARGISRAMESPLWHTFSSQSRQRLAEAIQSGKGDDAIRIVTPLISAIYGTPHVDAPEVPLR